MCVVKSTSPLSSSSTLISISALSSTVVGSKDNAYFDPKIYKVQCIVTACKTSAIADITFVRLKERENPLWFETIYSNT